MSGLTDRLRQVAGQATPGPWIQHLDCVTLEHSAADNEVGNLWHRDDAAHIATFDPVLVGLMLDVIDAVLDIAPGYDGHEGPYLGGVRADEMQAVNDALARFREVAS